MPKPDKTVDWATSAGRRTEPTAGEKASGFVAPQKPTAEVFNWLVGKLGEWSGYVNEVLPEVTAAHTDALGKVWSTLQDAANRGSKDLEGLSMAAIDRIVLSSPSIVDVFVYDTRKDSDGGAWRDRCQHLSWYNESLNTATRGKTRKFPAVALIVVSTKLTIYDATDPSLPMWLEQTTGADNATSVCAVNGAIYIGRSGNFGLRVFDLLADHYRGYRAVAGSSTIYDFRVSKLISTGTLPAIVNDNVNDVATTVLAGAPINPNTGLPVPTVAIATAVGVSVIKQDGTVINSAATNPMSAVEFLGGDLYFVELTSSAIIFARNVGTLSGAIPTVFYSAASIPSIQFAGAGSNNRLACTKTLIAKGSVSGLNLLAENKVSTNQGMIAYLTKDFATGWLAGDIRGAWLASSAAELLNSPALVNGGFDTDTDWTKGTGWSIGGGVASKVAGTASTLIQNLPLLANRVYIVTYSLTRTAGSIQAGIGASTGSFRGASGTYVDYILTGAAAGQGLYFSADASFAGTIDNIAIRLADDDRSAKAKGLGIYGSITKSAVAPGADLVAYSGFSAANYLEQPYNTELDYAGDFMYAGWVANTAATSIRFLFGRLYYTGSGWSGAGLYARLEADNRIRVDLSADGFNTTTSLLGSVLPTQATLITVCRRGNTVELWVNDTLAASAAWNSALTNPSATFRVGCRQDAAYVGTGCSLALLRTSAYAPTAEQVRQIYNDEKTLFADNAKCLLFGTSNTVATLGFDPDTNQLLVGTGNGLSVFSGLRRVAEFNGGNSRLTHSGMKAVSGANGALLMAGGNEAVYQVPQRIVRDEMAQAPFLARLFAAITGSPEVMFQASEFFEGRSSLKAKYAAIAGASGQPFEASAFTEGGTILANKYVLKPTFAPVTVNTTGSVLTSAFLSDVVDLGATVGVKYLVSVQMPGTKDGTPGDISLYIRTGSNASVSANLVDKVVGARKVGAGEQFLISGIPVLITTTAQLRYLRLYAQATGGDFTPPTAAPVLTVVQAPF